ncbi:Pickpocket protein 28 [Frankliniella fusca]|uniref:Pickpocket protein 28 n=1 Tax=Frankliniella fusca TaxID=407009 RepID=A0AAE1I2Y9_9NEOP|nr:Pickpocket protein 28 [Frankliniella fusca]
MARTARIPRLRCSTQMLSAGIKEYLQESSLHGLRYLADPGRHWSERLFWTIVCVAALIGTYFLLMSSYNAFQYHAVSFVSETAYLDWNTTFPAVSVCETESPDKLYESATKVFGVKRNRNLDFFLRDIVFFDGTCRSCSTQCGTVMNCTNDFLSIINMVRSNCTSLINNCRWNGEPFDCCQNFLPLQTETGFCFTINSLHNRHFLNGSRVNKQLIDLISNRRTGPGTLDFMAKESIKIFIHAPEDVPNFNHPQDEKESLFWGLNFHMRFAVTEIENDPQLLDVSVAQRNCRFPHENPLTLHDRYSYSTCIVECHAKYQMLFCNCTHHYMPNMHGLPVKTCGVEGLACLNQHSETLRSLKTSWSTKPGLACDCVSSCTEPEYSVVWKSSQGNDAEGDAEHEQEQGTRVRLMLDSLPTTRFRRNVVRTRLDLVVSMGGTAGLFLGASLLTLVELVYYACRTPSFKLRQWRQQYSKSAAAALEPTASPPGSRTRGDWDGDGRGLERAANPSALDAWGRLHQHGTSTSTSPTVRRVQPVLSAFQNAGKQPSSRLRRPGPGESAALNNMHHAGAFDLYM